MKAVVSLYLSFLVTLAVLVGAAGFYAQADRSDYAQKTERHGPKPCGE